MSRHLRRLRRNLEVTVKPREREQALDGPRRHHENEPTSVSSETVAYGDQLRQPRRVNEPDSSKIEYQGRGDTGLQKEQSLREAGGGRNGQLTGEPHLGAGSREDIPDFESVAVHDTTVSGVPFTLIGGCPHLFSVAQASISPWRIA